MSSNALDSESLKRLIKAVQNYKTELDTNANILYNAADVCDQAMGSDKISQKHIAELETAVESLKKAAKDAEEVVGTLQEQYKKAINIVDNA